MIFIDKYQYYNSCLKPGRSFLLPKPNFYGIITLVVKIYVTGGVFTGYK